MDESQQFEQVLDFVKPYLSSDVIATCESLNGHGEWELALAHCAENLRGVVVSEQAAALLAACATRFRGVPAGSRPTVHSTRTR